MNKCSLGYRDICRTYRRDEIAKPAQWRHTPRKTVFITSCTVLALPSHRHIRHTARCLNYHAVRIILNLNRSSFTSTFHCFNLHVCVSMCLLSETLPRLHHIEMYSVMYRKKICGLYVTMWWSRRICTIV